MKAGSTALKGLTNAEMHDRLATLESELAKLDAARGGEKDG